MPDPTVDLSLSVPDAKAARLALQIAIDSGYFTNAETYASVITVKAMLTYRIAKAEKLAAVLADVDALLEAS